MRSQLLKLRRSNSTKGERRIGEILKKNKIKFKARTNVGRYEVDFIIGRVILEVDGSVHSGTNTQKDIYLVNKGFVPLHFSTSRKNTETIEKTLINLIKNNG
ncbi:MAG: DUF559 domain-containing protein [Patescibacteria group bacterium]|jgi:very-short-patch-repair endonuclease